MKFGECDRDDDSGLAAPGDDDRDGPNGDEKDNGAAGRAQAGTARRDLDVGRVGEGRERPSKDGSRASGDDALRPAARSPDRVHGGGKEGIAEASCPFSVKSGLPPERTKGAGPLHPSPGIRRRLTTGEGAQATRPPKARCVWKRQRLGQTHRMTLDGRTTEVDHRRHGADGPPLGDGKSYWRTSNIQLLTAPVVNDLEDC